MSLIVRGDTLINDTECRRRYLTKYERSMRPDHPGTALDMCHCPECERFVASLNWSLGASMPITAGKTPAADVNEVMQESLDLCIQRAHWETGLCDCYWCLRYLWFLEVLIGERMPKAKAKVLASGAGK
jgi:hypothetical protein